MDFQPRPIEVEKTQQKAYWKRGCYQNVEKSSQRIIKNDDPNPQKIIAKKHQKLPKSWW